MIERRDEVLLPVFVVALLAGTTAAGFLAGRLLGVERAAVPIGIGVGVGAVVASAVVALVMLGRFARLAPPDEQEDVTE